MKKIIRTTLACGDKVVAKRSGHMWSIFLTRLSKDKVVATVEATNANIRDIKRLLTDCLENTPKSFRTGRDA